MNVKELPKFLSKFEFEDVVLDVVLQNLMTVIVTVESPVIHYDLQNSLGLHNILWTFTIKFSNA